MAETMWRAAKGEGVGNVFLEQVPVPEPGPEEVLTRTRVSLISRGSELWRRYVMEGPVSPSSMGYSTTGIVEAAGDSVRGFATGDRVVATAPHAEYSLCSLAADARADRLHRLHPELSFEQGTFHPLASSGAGWAQALEITADDRVAVLGQGLVGSLVMQFARRFRPAQLIAVDTLEIRCRIAREVGAPEVVHAGEEDPVEAVRRLTGGEGASIVVDCVGGPPGIASFEQAQKMLAPGGLIQVNAKYQNAPLPLDVDSFQGKRVLVSFPPTADRAAMASTAMAAMAAGEVQVEPLVTHRLPGRELKAGYDLLYEHPEQALGVLFSWE
ncbi:MAG: zinc-binding dehydrogenase [Spirochaetaceae bacterium]|nr:zinc-binding dehydrogenase [Spirochaetaceae bacterium]